MAVWIHKKFASAEQLTDWLNGVLVGSVNLHAAGADVDGKTLIVDLGAGAATVTFAPPKGTNWTLEEIIDQINAHVSIPAGTASAEVSLKNQVGARPNRRLRLSSQDGCIVRSTGTANADLGFSIVSDTEQLITPAAAVKHIHFDESYSVLMYQ